MKKLVLAAAFAAFTAPAFAADDKKPVCKDNDGKVIECPAPAPKSSG